MEYRQLGDSGIEVSKICLGTMTFGEQNTEAEAHEQLNYAIERGINFIDTAELYAIPSRKETQGLTEQYIGTWLKDKKREELIVATKIVGPSPNLTYIRKPLDFSDNSIDHALEASLKRLQTDYVDLYQLHWPVRKTNRFGIRNFQSEQEKMWESNFLQVIRKLSLLISEGKIRTWGLSNETPWGLMHCLHLCQIHNLPRPVSVQNAYSLINRTYEYGLSEISLMENVGLLAYSPLAMGLLSGKYHNDSSRPENRLNQFGHKFPRYNSDHIKDIVSNYIKIAEDASMSPTSLSLSFVNDRSFVTSNIIGATSLDQLKEDIDSAEIRLEDPTLNAIENIHNLYPNPAP